MDGFKVVGLHKNAFEKDGTKVSNITVYLTGESEDVVGVTVSSFYCSDARSPKTYLKCETLNLGDVVVPVFKKVGQYDVLDNVIIIARAK